MPGANRGISASKESKEIDAAEVSLRVDMVDLIFTKRQYRRPRRNDLPTETILSTGKPQRIKEGWRSLQRKAGNYIQLVKKILPAISSKKYPIGEQLGFWKVGEYVLGCSC